MRDLWDVAIIGAGPAGATAAIHLARAGHEVLLLDKARFPRPKVCGDALIADTWRSLKRAGLLERIQQLAHRPPSLAIFSPSQIRVDVPGALLTLKRLTFDAVLVSEAVRCGAVLRQCAVSDITPHANGTVSITSRKTRVTIRARVVVLATGADVSLASRLGLVVRPQPSAIALRCYVKSPVALESLVISFDRAIIPGYAWIFPLGHGEYNLGCGAVMRRARTRVNLRSILATFTRAFPLARDIMGQAVDVTPPQGAMLRCGLTGTRLAHSANVLVAGETAGATFPFSGEGIGKAMETGAIAAEVIDGALRTGQLHTLNEYEQRLTNELKPRYVGYEFAQRWLSIAWLSDAVAARATKSAYVREALVGILNETTDPRDVCSVRGLLKSLLK